MANPLSIYSGPGFVAFDDPVNGLFLPGHTGEINIEGEPRAFEAMDGNSMPLSMLFKFKAGLLQSNQAQLDELISRRVQKQTIYVLGFESMAVMKNVYPSGALKRGFKAGEGHLLSVEAQTGVEADVYNRENLFDADGSFELDGNSDGLADGWNKIATGTASIVASFVSGGGNAQQFLSVAGNDGIYKDVVMPFNHDLTLTLSVNAKNVSGTTQSMVLELQTLNAAGGVIATYTGTAESFTNNEIRRVSLNQAVSPAADVKTVRARIKIVTANKTFQWDQAQLELGQLTDYREN